jgi:acetoin utilization deacetylase AcuC-like enzyme
MAMGMLFKDNPSVFIVDAYQTDNYPETKIFVDKAITFAAPEEVTDEKYLAQFRPAVQGALARFTPDLVFYLDGADPLATDKLGGFKLTVNGLRQRDEYVIRTVREREIPLVVALAGGYSSNPEEVVQVHFNCAQLLQRF